MTRLRGVGKAVDRVFRPDSIDPGPGSLPPLGTRSPEMRVRDPRWEAARRLARMPLSVLGLVIILLFAFLALFPSGVAPYDPIRVNMAHGLEAPGRQYLLGTDYYGRDIWSRVVYGASTSLLAGCLTVLASALIGVPLGLLAGYLGGRTGMLIMRAMDVVLSFPTLVLAIALTSALGPGLQNAMVAIVVISVPSYARVVRSQAISIKEIEYIAAARSVGASNLRIMFAHVLPNCLSPVIVQTTLGIGSAILATAALGFLGLGAQPPTPDWGWDVSSGTSYITTAPWVSIFPGVAIMLAVLGFNLLGDGLVDVLNPLLKER